MTELTADVNLEGFELETEGVQRVGVDIIRGTVEVEFNEPANEEVIKNCIEKTGYRVI